MLLNTRAKNLDPNRSPRIDTLMRGYKINTTAKVANLLTEVWNEGKVNPGAARNGRQTQTPTVGAC
jgi:hypothetical protein